MLVFYYILLLEILYASTIITARPSAAICVFEKQNLICENDLPEVKYTNNVTGLELSHLKWDVLDLNRIVKQFPYMENFTVYDSDIVSVIPPEEYNHIKVLILRNLRLTNLSSSFLLNFPNINVLNLEGNRLTKLATDFSIGTINELYLRNNRWDCTKNLDWILNLNVTIVKDMDKLTCVGKPHTGKPISAIITFLKDIKANCTPTCDCSLRKVIRDLTSDHLEPIIVVNCSYRGFTELPDRFPHHTRILHLEGNALENVKSLKTNRIYRRIWELYLDNNEITSITVLEGSYWLRHFRVFSLRRNELSKIPSFALDNALMKNPNMPNALRLFLGDNPWRCDCVFIPVFQEFVLEKYANQIGDIKDVKCSYVEGDENSLLPIISLTRGSVCRLPTEFSLQQGLNLLNVVLASLIIFIFAKLAYDYYYFKKTGKLPWIATKMP